MQVKPVVLPVVSLFLYFNKSCKRKRSPLSVRQRYPVFHAYSNKSVIKRDKKCFQSFKKESKLEVKKFLEVEKKMLKRQSTMDSRRDMYLVGTHEEKMMRVMGKKPILLIPLLLLFLLTSACKAAK